MDADAAARIAKKVAESEIKGVMGRIKASANIGDMHRVEYMKLSDAAVGHLEYLGYTVSYDEETNKTTIRW